MKTMKKTVKPLLIVFRIGGASVPVTCFINKLNKEKFNEKLN